MHNNYRGRSMHLSDGVLSTVAILSTSAGAAGLIGYSLKGIKDYEIPRVSIMTATFFTLSMLSIPIGPSSTHPLIAGLLGIILGKRSPIAIFIGLLLQAFLFGHGGLTTLGANTLLVGIPAISTHFIYQKWAKDKVSPYFAGGLLGVLSIFLCLVLLIGLLFFTDERYSQGFFSVANLLIVSHIPLMIIEGFMTSFAVGYIMKVKPEMLMESSSGYEL
ncbi:CbiM family transporter [Acetoanaerobium pronyense]